MRMVKLRIRKVHGPILALAIAVALCCGMLPVPAWAYYSLAPVQVYLGSSSLSLTSGDSASIGCGLSIASEGQTIGCGMAECPQGCGDLTTPSGVKGGCADANGWCTCMGTAYSTYYTNVAVYSDNPGVARASYSGGVLNVVGYGAGSATLTVTASLRQHNDATAYVTVHVSDPAPSSSGGTSGGSATSEGASVSGTAASASGDPAAAVTVSPTGVPAASATVAATDEKNETVVQAADGTKALIVQANDAANCADELAQIAGTDGSCTFWTGSSSDKPDISWTFKGRDLDPAGNLNMDLDVTVSEKGTGAVADALANAKDSLVMEWKHTGALPGKATVYVRTSGKYADGTSLSLYCFDDATQKFDLVKSGVAVANGYASFDMDHCSTWVLSTDDLTAYSATSDGDGQGVVADIAKVNTEGASNGLPWAALIGGIVAACAVVAIGVAVLVRKKRAQAIEPDVGAVKEF
jgi:hypothetical protein